MSQSDHTRSPETATEASTDTDTFEPIAIRFRSSVEDNIRRHLERQETEDLTGAADALDTDAARATLTRRETWVRVHSATEAEALRHVLADTPVDVERGTVRALRSLRRLIDNLDEAMRERGYEPVVEDRFAVEEEFRGYERRAD